MDMCGYTRIYVEVCGDTWIYIDIRGYTWICAKRHIQNDGAGGGGGEVNAVCVQHICACEGGGTLDTFGHT